MALFRYEAVDSKGRVLRGAMNARSESEVADNLTSKGYGVRFIQSTNPRQSSSSHQASASSQSRRTAPTSVPISVRSVVPLASLAAFFRQLSILLKSGISVHQALSDITATSRQRKLRAALPVMRDSVQSGNSLSSAMAAYPGIFPVWTTACVWAGELSGSLDIALEQVADDLEREAKDARFGSIWWIITKLTILLAVTFLPLFDLSKVITPAIGANQLDPVGDILIPTLYRLIKWLIVAGFFGVAFLGWTEIKRIPALRSALDAVLLCVPVWGKLHKYRSLNRFLRSMDMMYAAGIPPTTAWDAASLTAPNNAVAQKLKQSASAGGSTESASNRFAAAGLFDSDDIGMAAAGERSGRLPDAFAQLARTYNDRAAAQKSMGRIWSTSAFISFQIAISGLLMIIMTYSYFKSIFGIAGGI